MSDEQLTRLLEALRPSAASSENHGLLLALDKKIDAVSLTLKDELSKLWIHNHEKEKEFTTTLGELKESFLNSRTPNYGLAVSVFLAVVAVIGILWGLGIGPIQSAVAEQKAEMKSTRTNEQIDKTREESTILLRQAQIAELNKELAATQTTLAGLVKDFDSFRQTGSPLLAGKISVIEAKMAQLNYAFEDIKTQGSPITRDRLKQLEADYQWILKSQPTTP